MDTEYAADKKIAADKIAAKKIAAVETGAVLVLEYVRREPSVTSAPANQEDCSCRNTCFATHLSVSKTPSPLTATASKES